MRKTFCDICKKEGNCKQLFFGNNLGFTGNPKTAKQIFFPDVCKKCFNELFKKFQKILREF